MGEVARQFEAGTVGGAADVERPLMATAQLAGKAGQGLGIVGDPEVGRPVLEVEILSDERVGLVGVDDDRLLIAGDQIAETRMLEEVTAEGVAGGLERLVAGADPAAPLIRVCLPSKVGVEKSS